MPAREAKRQTLGKQRLTHWLSSLPPTRCTLFLVLKAELELARNDIDLCQSDLQQVLFLLESCTGEPPCPHPTPCTHRWWRDGPTHCNTPLYVLVWCPSKSESYFRFSGQSSFYITQITGFPLSDDLSTTNPTCL